jgi:hypothetical protein
MRAVPFHQCEFISKADIPVFERSDRIFIHHSVYTSEGFTGGPLLLQISNKINKHVTGTLHNIYGWGTEEVIYMPAWMICKLDVTENLSISSVPIHVCKKISLRPHNSGLLLVEDWHLKFAAAIRTYNTLSIETRIPMVIDDKYMFMSIVALNDNTHSTYYLANGENIDIELLEPVESLVCRPVPTPFLYRDPTKTITYIERPFTGLSHVLGDAPSRPIRELAHEAALKRQQKMKEGIEEVLEPQEIKT